MADSTDIDALVIQARATTRELNELLDKLEAGGVRVSVVQPPAVPGAGFRPDRVELGLIFPAEGTPYPTRRHDAANSAPQGTVKQAASPQELLGFASKTGMFL